MNQESHPETDLYSEVGAKIQAVRGALASAVVGQEEVLEQLMIALLAGGHVLLEGVPGLGKTLMVRALARAIGGNFSRVQFTPDLMPSDVTGHAIYSPKTESFHVRRGPIFANLLLADEINRAPAKTQAALLEVMQEHQVTIEGQPLALDPPFMAIATQNPIDHEGTYPLPEAQLDRFLFKVLIEYPDQEVERQVVELAVSDKVGDTLDVSAVETVLGLPDVLSAQRLVARLRVEPRVVDYAVRIARATRDWPGISHGAGPRGPIAMVRAARAAALLAGRDYVTPDDVKRIAPPALRHRVILAPELQIEGVQVDGLMAELLGQVEAPRE